MRAADLRDAAAAQQLERDRAALGQRQQEMAAAREALRAQEAEVAGRVATLEQQRAEVERQRAEVESAERRRCGLPAHWSSTGAGAAGAAGAAASATVVPLAASDPEYQTAVWRFEATCRDKTVVGVARVQHPGLWHSYAAYRDFTVAPVNDDEPNELQLFHGTDADVVGKLVTGANQCFNRAYTTAHRYGKGVYFARDASYSAAPRYSTPDGQGVQRMFLARVAVGSFVVGQQDLVDAPPRDAGAQLLYDSVVDRVDDPAVYVVFRDYAAYPEYLITFR